MCGLIYLNQVLFTIYVVREHSGDPAFIAQHLPDGWFALADGSLIEALSRRFPAPELLAPSVLRVNAFLELPFVIFAYLTVCRWFSTEAYRQVLASVWLLGIFYTVTFCLIEWRFYNPYTVDDIVIRVLAAAVVPVVAARLRADGTPGETRNWPGLLVFVLAAAGLGIVVLVVYDTALLYNLGDLDRQQLLVGLSALLVVVGARRLALRVPDWSPGVGIDAMARSLSWLLALVAVPALSIRYGLGFGAPHVSATAALVLAVAAAGLGIRDVLAGRPGQSTRLLLSLATGAFAALCAASAGLLVEAEHFELRLLVAGATGTVAAVMASAALDRWSPVAQGRHLDVEDLSH